MSGGRAPKRKGAAFENEVAKWLRSQGFEVTRAKQGNATGDIVGVEGIVFEAKNQKAFNLAGWTDQMLDEVEAAGARFGFVVAKRPRKTNIGECYFATTGEMAVALLKEAGYGR